MKRQKTRLRNTDSLRAYHLHWFIAGQLALGSFSMNAQAREYFNPALLEIDNPSQGSADLTVFEEGAGQPPGTYRVDIYINDQQFDTRDVEFQLKTNADGKALLQPCLSVEMLQEMGVKTSLFTVLTKAESHCADLDAIPQATAEFQFSAQRLLLSVPQAAVILKPRGYVPESQWDNGISALLLNYNLSGSHDQARNSTGRNGDSQYASLRPGINVGPWRLRNYTTWNRNSEGQEQWDTVYTYLQRGLIGLKSQLILGDSSSPSDVFDSVPFRGVQMASDDDMVPDSQKGYAPVVRGIARTNAQIVIRQNGYIIYQSSVAPGAFEITDLYPTGSSGDMYVTVKEADGSQSQFVVPYASLPVLQREGRVKYSVTGGQYRSYDSNVEKTTFGQTTAIYGLPAGATAYGGAQAASNYHSVVLGVGKNLGDFGAVSADITQAWSTLKKEPQDSGQSWRVRYSKNMLQTGTNVAIAGYRYSTAGYYSLQEVMDSYRSGFQASYYERRRNRSELTLSQNLSSQAGAVSLSWVSEDYWNSDRSLRSVSAGYNNSWKYISYGLNYTYSQNASAGGQQGGKIYQRDQILSLNISVSLDYFLPGTYASYGLNTSKQGNTTSNVGLNGTALADSNLSWSVQQGYGNQGAGNTSSMNADYRGTYGELSAGYGYDQNSQRMNYGLQGGILAHENGVTFGQPLGETVALIKASGASGVGVINRMGVKTDWRGYAIVPYTSPYRSNQVQLDTETLPDNVELELTSQNVVPTRGAVVRADFAANVGKRVMMTLLREGGMPVPFGAMVSNPLTKNTQGFIVGDNGQVYLTGMQESGELVVEWGSESNQKCNLTYALPKADPVNGIVMLSAQCHA